MQYKVLRRFANFKVGQIVDDSTLRARRKIQEGNTLEPLSDVENKESTKMTKSKYENKEAI